MVVGVALAMSAAATVITIGGLGRERRPRTDILAALARNAGPADVVMSPDAGAYRYHGGWSGIVTPDDPLPVVEEALRLYGARWLVLEQDHITADLRPVLAGEVRPRWLSAPLISVPGTGPADSDEVELDELSRDASSRGALRRLPVRCRRALCNLIEALPLVSVTEAGWWTAPRPAARVGPEVPSSAPILRRTRIAVTWPGSPPSSGSRRTPGRGEPNDPGRVQRT